MAFFPPCSTSDTETGAGSNDDMLKRINRPCTWRIQGIEFSLNHSIMLSKLIIVVDGYHGSIAKDQTQTTSNSLSEVHGRSVNRREQISSRSCWEPSFCRRKMISTAQNHKTVRETHPVAFSNCSRPVSVIFSLVERIFAGSTLPPPNFFSTASSPVVVHSQLQGTTQCARNFDTPLST